MLAAITAMSAAVMLGVAAPDPVTKNTQVDHVSDRGIEVVNASGNVHVIAKRVDGKEAETAKVRVKAEIKADTKERALQTKVRAERNPDGSLLVEIDWPGGERKLNESANIRVEGPDFEGADVRTSNGQIRLEGLSGDANLHTSNGSIEVRSHEGSLTLETTNGKADLRDIAGRVSAKVTNGGITLSRAASAVNIEASNGTLEISLTDDNAGPVEAKTTNGGIRLEVGKGFAGSIRAETANGEVDIELPGLIRSSKQERGGQVVELINDGEASNLKASNGSITVRADD